MLFKFGFVSNATCLWDASPQNLNVCALYNTFRKRTERGPAFCDESKSYNTLRTIHYVIGHGIPLYRFSSSIVPLATHPDVRWDFVTPFRQEFREIGELVRKYDLRTSFHPNQFTLSQARNRRLPQMRSRIWPIIMTCWTLWASRIVPSLTFMSGALTATNKARLAVSA